MKYYKISDIMSRYSVSDKTVRNWIEASQAGKTDLKLAEVNSKVYIADSVTNNYLLEKLADKGKKYRNSRSFKTLKPKDEFYRLFQPWQVIDLANSLESYHELAWDYSYFGEAATYWDKYLTELYEAGKGNLITNTIEAINLNIPYLDAILEPYDHINIINICIGNNIAIRDVLQHFHGNGKLKKFITADFSPDLTRIATGNVRQWFGGQIEPETHIVDIRHESLKKIIPQDTFGADASKTANLFFLIAGPVINFRAPQQVLRNIQQSMSNNDLLFVAMKRDTDRAREFFDFNIKSDRSLLGARRKMLLDLLNIDESFYDVEQAFDREQNIRFIRVRLTVGLFIDFKTGQFEKAVELKKGDTLLLWRAHRFSDLDLINLLDGAGFSQVQTAHSSDRELLLTVSKIKTVHRD